MPGNNRRIFIPEGFAPYPGDVAMKKFLQESQGKSKKLDAIMLVQNGTHKALKGIWDSLAGNYIMGTVGVVGSGATLYNILNNNNNDQNIH